MIDCARRGTEDGATVKRRIPQHPSVRTVGQNPERNFGSRTERGPIGDVLRLRRRGDEHQHCGEDAHFPAIDERAYVARDPVARARVDAWVNRTDVRIGLGGSAVLDDGQIVVLLFADVNLAVMLARRKVRLKELA